MPVGSCQWLHLPTSPLQSHHFVPQILEQSSQLAHPASEHHMQFESLRAGLKAWRRARFANAVRLLTDLDEDGLKYVLKNLPAWVKVRDRLCFTEMKWHPSGASNWHACMHTACWHDCTQGIPGADNSFWACSSATTSAPSKHSRHQSRSYCAHILHCCPCLACLLYHHPTHPLALQVPERLCADALAGL